MSYTLVICVAQSTDHGLTLWRRCLARLRFDCSDDVSDFTNAYRFVLYTLPTFLQYLIVCLSIFYTANETCKKLYYLFLEIYARFPM